MTTVAAPVQSKREALATLGGAERVHAEALTRWRDVKARELQLRRQGVLTELGKKTERLTEVALEVALADLAREKEQAARELHAATAELQAARVEATNAKLPGLVAEHAEAVSVVEQERKRCEAAWAKLAISGWRMLDAIETERQAARRVVSAAKDAAGTEETRSQIDHRAVYEIPTLVGPDGPEEHVARPALRLFEGERGEEFDVRSGSFGDVLGRLIRLGRDKGRRELGKVPRETLDRELARGNGHG